MWIKDTVWMSFFWIFKKPLIKCRKQDYCNLLSAYGIEGKVLCWIADFLSDRKMRIMVRGEYSEWVDVISGVPQGSVLGQGQSKFGDLVVAYPS